VDLKSSKGFRLHFKELRSGLNDFRSDIKVSWPYSRDYTSDFKDFKDFTPDFNDFKLNFRNFISNFKDYWDF